jgi:hypothetical protein
LAVLFEPGPVAAAPKKLACRQIGPVSFGVSRPTTIRRKKWKA